MHLSIRYPFETLPAILFALIEKVQAEKGIVTIYSIGFSDLKYKDAAKQWLLRMLKAHHSDDHAMSLYKNLRWSEVR